MKHLMIWMVVVLCGCGGRAIQPGQRVEQKPESIAVLETVTEKVENLNQKVEQVQVAISTQTQNYQLDGERAKVEAERNRNLLRTGISMGVMLMGLALLCLCSPALSLGSMTFVVIVMGILMMCGPAALLWIL